MKSKEAYQSTYVRCLMEVVEECRLELPLAMVVSFVRLQNFVEPLVKECPEVMKWAIISHAFANVGRIMVIWL